MKKIKIRYMFIISSASAAVFLLIAFLLNLEPVEQWDLLLGKNLYQFAQLDSFFILLSYIGSRLFFYPALIVITFFLIIKKKWKYVVLLWINLIGVRLLNTFLKSTYVRERPTLEHIVDAGYYSFPSGHAMNSTAFFGILAFLLFFVSKHKWSQYSSIFGFTLLIILIGLSRIYLGVHFPLDVFAGFLAGTAWMLFILGIWLWFNYHKG